MNFVHLIKFIVSGKEGEQSKNFEVHATDTPVIHFMIVVSVC